MSGKRPTSFWLMSLFPFIEGNGQDNGKCTTLSRDALNKDLSVVVFDDTIAHRQPQTSALPGWFGCKKGIEDFLLDLRGDAGAGVHHGNGELISGRIVISNDLNLSLYFNGLFRVHQEIHEDLFQFFPISVKGRNGGAEFGLYSDIVQFELVIYHRYDLEEEVIDIDRSFLGF